MKFLRMKNLPRLIIVFGEIGAGKTTLAKGVAKKLSYMLVHFDEYMWIATSRKEIYGSDDEFLLNDDEVLQIYNKMLVDAKKFLLAGKDVILESMYYKKQREDVIRMAEDIGCTYKILEIRCSKDSIINRLKIRKALNPQSSGEKLFLKYFDTIEPEERDHIIVDITDKTADDCILEASSKMQYNGSI